MRLNTCRWWKSLLFPLPACTVWQKKIAAPAGNRSPLFQLVFCSLCWLDKVTIEADQTKFARQFYRTSHHKISSKSVECIRRWSKWWRSTVNLPTLFHWMNCCLVNFTYSDWIKTWEVSTQLLKTSPMLALDRSWVPTEFLWLHRVDFIVRLKTNASEAYFISIIGSVSTQSTLLMERD